MRSKPLRRGPREEPAVDEFSTINVRRPRRYWKRLRFWLLALVLLALVLLSVRVLTISWPAFQVTAVKIQDGLRVLRGAFHLKAVSGGGASRAEEVARGAFRQGLQFVVLADPGNLQARELAHDAPLALVVGEELKTSLGSIVVLNAPREVNDLADSQSGVFARVRNLGGWSVLDRVMDPESSWKAWELKDFEAVEFFSAARPSSDLPLLEGFGSWIGWLFKSSFGLAPLTVRPVEALAHWDDTNQKGRTIGFCGLDVGVEKERLWGALSTYVLVEDGLGPWGPGEITEALRSGHHFCALPFLGDPSGFRFFARLGREGERVALMGDQVKVNPSLELVADLHLPNDPGNLTMVLYQDGVQVVAAHGSQLTFPVKGPGSYRVEVTVRTDKIPWGSAEREFLYSNPIHVVPEGQPPAVSPGRAHPNN